MMYDVNVVDEAGCCFDGSKNDSFQNCRSRRFEFCRLIERNLASSRLDGFEKWSYNRAKTFDTMGATTCWTTSGPTVRRCGCRRNRSGGDDRATYGTEVLRIEFDF